MMEKFNRLIGIDFEFCTDKTKDFGLDEPMKAHPYSKKLYCVAICENRKTRVWWLQEKPQRECFIEWFNSIDKTSTLFLSHFYELAEAQCLFTLGIDTTNLYVFDTGYTLFTMNPDNIKPDMLKKATSLANMCKTYLNIDIDTVHKNLMRQLCIEDTVEGNEDSIMNYCASDTIHLEELYNNYRRMYGNFMYSAYQHLTTSFDGDDPYKRKLTFDDWVLELAKDLQVSQIIARNGIPVDTGKLMALRKGLRAYIIEYKNKFNKAFPGIYISKKGELHAVQAKIQEYASADLSSLNLLSDWPKTDTDKLKLEKKHICKVFDIREDPSITGSEHFMHWYSYMVKFVDSEMASISKEDISKSWCKNLYNDRIWCYSVQPNKAKTQRWQGMPSEGYVPQWHRPFRAVLNPPPGKILCECDFHSEETAIFAILFKDKKYVEQYKTDDPYIFNAIQMGLLPAGIKKADLNKDQVKIRKKVKTFSLAWQYGSGYKSLARDLNICEAEAKEYKDKLDRIYKASKERQQYFINAASPTYKGSSYHKELVMHDAALILPDGYPIFLGKNGNYKPNTLGNQPIQSFGAYILRQCVRAVIAAGLKVIATVHDAIWIEANNLNECEQLRQIMYTVATKCLRKELLTVGEPFTILHGEYKCEEVEDTERFNYFIKDNTDEK